MGATPPPAPDKVELLNRWQAEQHPSPLDQSLIIMTEVLLLDFKDVDTEASGRDCVNELRK